MILLRPQDAYHKSQLVRLLIEVVDNPVLSQNLRFKRGTCAAMRGYLDRFSVDLDFDRKMGSEIGVLKTELEKIFETSGLQINDRSRTTVDYVVKYVAPVNIRNSIKLDAVDFGAVANKYEPAYLSEIDRVVTCQTIDTMFANKLVAPLDRFKRNGSLAVRDIYDIHHFFIKGYVYHAPVIEERTGVSVKAHLSELARFIEKHVTQTSIDEDLNTLLSKLQFGQIRKVLLPETLAIIRNEMERL